MLVYDVVALAQCLARLDDDVIKCDAAAAVIATRLTSIPAPLRIPPPARVEFCAVGLVLAPLVPSSAAWPF